MNGLVRLGRGQHWLLDLFGCDPGILNDKEKLRALLRAAAEAAGARIVADIFHTFAPQGVTGVIVVEESHLSIHTWPEHGYAALDFYTCGAVSPEAALSELGTLLGATRREIMQISRCTDPQQTLQFAARRSKMPG